MRRCGLVISCPDRRPAALPLPLILILLHLTGCMYGPELKSLPAPLELNLAKRGDPMLRKSLMANSPMPFAVIARFNSPIFPYQSELLADAGIPPVESTGSTTLLVATAREISGLFDSPSLLSIRFLGTQSSLARLHPQLEIELLRRFDEKKESLPIRLLVRFRFPPEKAESEAIAAAGFMIETRNGSSWEIRGALDRLPALLAIDEIIYLEIAS